MTPPASNSNSIPVDTSTSRSDAVVASSIAPGVASPENVASRRTAGINATDLRVSIFCIPKPFSGHTGLIQRNAIGSWLNLGPRVEVLIGGDDEGVADAARELGAEHLGKLDRSPQGTPRLDHLFEQAHARATGDLMMYVNADILLFPDLLAAVDQLQQSGATDYLAIGRRIDLDVEQPLSYADPRWMSEFLTQATRRGKVAPAVCKDYFLFPRTLYRELPEFLVGRGNWDNWMVHQAKWSRVPVIDVTRLVSAIHQNHDYGHLKRGRLEAYVTGDEARHNERVGGGKHVVSGATADWEFVDGRLKRRFGNDWLRFAGDLPRFLGLLGSFLTRR